MTTQAFLLKKSPDFYQTRAKRVILSMSEPLGFKAIYPLIEFLKISPFCRTIAVVADDLAARNFLRKAKGLGFSSLKPARKDGSLPDWLAALRNKGEESFDLAITTVDSYTRPNVSLLYQAKSSLGAAKLFIVHYSWTCLGSRRDLLRRQDSRSLIVKQVDGIFCNDGLTKSIILEHLRTFPENKIFITGTPVIDGLETAQAGEYRRTCRQELRLSDRAIVVLYLGDAPDDYKKDRFIDPAVNKKTFLLTFKAMIGLAEQQPDKEFVLLCRPHPRAQDKNKLPAFVETKKLPLNLKVLLIVNNNIFINKLVYASDVVASIASTENHLAPWRGKTGIFLGYKQNSLRLQLGDRILKELYGPRIIEKIKKTRGIFVVSSPKEFLNCLSNYSYKQRTKQRETDKYKKTSAQKILDIVL